MSKIGKAPIPIPAGVTVTSDEKNVIVKGAGGTMTLAVLPYIRITINDGNIELSTENTRKQGRSNWGTMASLIRNAIHGVVEPFVKNLEIEGIGFKAALEGNTLVLNVGFTHPVKFVPPPGVSVTVEKNRISVRGIDRALVGLAAARIRKIKKPEPYKGKGIHYVGEIIRRKATKKVTGTAGATQ